MKNSHFKTITLLAFAVLLFGGCGTTVVQQTQQTPVRPITPTVNTATQSPIAPNVVQPVTNHITVTAPPPAPTPTALIYNLVEVSKHNNANDCWVVIEGGVYNVTSYIPQHPGGPQTVIRSCGKDGTSIFNLKHSPDKKQYLTPYFLANLNK